MTIDSPRGRKMSRRPDGLIGLDPKVLTRDHGITLLPRAVEGDRVAFEGGRSLRFRTVLWATASGRTTAGSTRPSSTGGRPVHTRGVTAAPGLYRVGLKWLYRIDSSLLGGVGQDAEYLAERIAGLASPPLRADAA